MNLIEMLQQRDILFYLERTMRLVFALILGGVIGYERENLHRPAGFRTHILVCVGSALVMLTSEFMFIHYSGKTNADPARLGAQVISGIGFLGAGTIMREGFSVKGLTTAASLWAVSCVGIAVGIGYYEGAVVATVLIYLTLITLKRMQTRLLNRRMKSCFYIYADYIPEKIGGIKNILTSYNIPMKHIEFLENDTDYNVVVRFYIVLPNNYDKEQFVSELIATKMVRKIYEC